MASLKWRNWGDHPVVTVITVLASLTAIITFFRSCSTVDVANTEVEPCVEVVGRWDWLTTGGEVAIAQGGQISWYPTPLNPVPAETGRWVCDPESGQIRLDWNNGFTETMTLSGDARRLSGTNNVNVSISATRAQ